MSERKPTKTNSNHGFGSVLIRLAAFLSFPFISERKPTKTDSNHGFGSVLIRLVAFPFISFHFGKETHQNGFKSWIWLGFDPFGCFFSFPFISERKPTKTDSNHGFGSVLIVLGAFLFISFHFGKETHQNGLKSWIWFRFVPFGCFSFHFVSFRKGNPPKRIQIMDLAPF